MKPFSNETLNCFPQKVLSLLKSKTWQNCMSSANLVPEIQFKLSNDRALSTGEPCTCEYVTFLQSFHRGALSIHCYIAQNFYPTFSICVLYRRSFQTAMFSRFLKVAIATSNFKNQVYNCGFAPEFSVLMLKEIIALVSDYVFETMK